MTCPYGKFFIRKGNAFTTNNSGLRLSIDNGSENYIANFIHSTDSYLESGDKFVSVTENIITHITPKKIILFGGPFIISNMIKLTLKNKSTKKIIASKYIGQLNQTMNVDYIKFTSPSIIDLHNDSIILEIDSIYWQDTEPCCDKLPSSINIVDVPREVGGSRFLCFPLEQYYILPPLTDGEDAVSTYSTIPSLYKNKSEYILTINNPIAHNDAVFIDTIPFGSDYTLLFVLTDLRLYWAGIETEFSYWIEQSINAATNWQRISDVKIGKTNNSYIIPIKPSTWASTYYYRIVTSNPFGYVDSQSLISNIFTLNFQPLVTTTTTTSTTPACISVSTTTTTTLGPSIGYLVEGAFPEFFNGIYCEYGTYGEYNFPAYKHYLEDIYIYLIAGVWYVSTPLGSAMQGSYGYNTSPIPNPEYLIDPYAIQYLPIVPSSPWNTYTPEGVTPVVTGSPTVSPHTC
jgi:hypothetical protein